MGFLSRYSGTDIIDLGDGYTVTVLQHLPGDAQEAAEAAKVKAIANVESDGQQRTVAVETSQDVARYTTLLLHAAIVSWNLTDEYDRPLPLQPEEQRLASIKRLPAEVRTRLRDHIEANMAAEARSPEEQKHFRAGDHVSGPVGEGRPADPAGSETPGSVLEPAGSVGV